MRGRSTNLIVVAVMLTLGIAAPAGELRRIWFSYFPKK